MDANFGHSGCMSIARIKHIDVYIIRIYVEALNAIEYHWAEHSVCKPASCIAWIFCEMHCFRLSLSLSHFFYCCKCYFIRFSPLCVPLVKWIKSIRFVCALMWCHNPLFVAGPGHCVKTILHNVLLMLQFSHCFFVFDFFFAFLIHSHMYLCSLAFLLL